MRLRYSVPPSDDVFVCSLDTGFGRILPLSTWTDRGPSLQLSSVSYLESGQDSLLTNISERALINGDWSRMYLYFGLVSVVSLR